MPAKGNDFQWTRSEKAADMTYDRYGVEHDEAVEDLADFENGVRAYWARKLREFVDSPEGLAYDGVGIMTAARLLDPYTEDDDRPEAFTRTRAEGDECGNWELKP